MAISTGNGRKTVYIGSHASHIEGLAVQEGWALLQELLGGRRRADSMSAYERIVVGSAST
jgi:hypothetical protein